MPVPLEDGIFDDGLLVVGDLIGVDHVVEHELGDVIQVVGSHVQANGAVQQHRPQLKQGVQGQGCHVGLGPAIATLLHVLFELYPSVS